MFPEEFINRVCQEPLKEKIMVDVNIADNPIVNKEVFYNNLYNVDNIPDYELYNIIKGSIDVIISDITNHYDSKYIQAFINVKFLTCFIKVMSSIPITYERRLCCNKLAYDYLTYKTDDPNEAIKQLFLNLSKVVNKIIIIQLYAIGLDEKISANLALVRYSSTNEVVNVKRLNFAIESMPIEIMTEQTIIYIYEKLFDRAGSIFDGTMFEVYTEEEEDLYGDEFMEIYSTISLAVLTILNNMPSQDIRAIISKYIKTYKFNNCPKTRFSLRALSSEFSRVSDIVEELRRSGVYVP